MRGVMSGPVTVFQCKGCLRIIADSSELIKISEEVGMIQLSGISDCVSEVGQLVTPTDGPDAGCAYVTLKCNYCSNTLGRHYKGTTSQLDRIRNTYIMFTEKIIRYQIGQINQDGREESHSVFSEEISLIKETILSLANSLNSITKAMISKGILSIEDIERYSGCEDNEEYSGTESCQF